jgi:hypothetical protein
MKTTRKMLPIVAKANMSPIAAATMRTVRTGRSSSTRLLSRSAIGRTLFLSTEVR